MDALPTGGKISIRTRVSGPDVLDTKGAYRTYVIAEISDSGIGMNEETRKRCLEPFFSTKGKRGTGLGLAMVYGVIQRHEGQIEIDSEVGKGTTFRLIFPVRNSLRRETAGEPIETAMAPLKILCIDDEPLLRELLRKCFRTGWASRRGQ